jgi:hypothetical protein
VSVTLTDDSALAAPPEDYRDGRTMVTAPPEGTVVAGTALRIISAHA